MTLRDMPFSRLVQTDPTLSEARREYAGKSRKGRRMAAQWEYESAMASDLFGQALARTGSNDLAMPCHDPGVIALAIDPLFAPALLTVGSLEYQHDRVDEAMVLFMTLTTLPKKEPDLPDIIDKAGCFLCDHKDYANAARLYRASTERYPTVASHWSGLSYSLGHTDDLEEAVACARKSVELGVRDAENLNDLGWTLVLAGQYEEARNILQEAVRLSSEDYKLPRNNLIELERRIRERGTKT